MRHVTGTAGALLILLALIVFAMIGVTGIRLLAAAHFDVRHQYTIATGLVVGLLPILTPNLYHAFPGWMQVVLGNGMAAGTLTAILVNAAFSAVGTAARPHAATTATSTTGTPT